MIAGILSRRALSTSPRRDESGGASAAGKDDGDGDRLPVDARTRPRMAVQRPPYDGCKLMYGGELLAHIPRKRRDWYLKRGLARVLHEAGEGDPENVQQKQEEEEEEDAIELLFCPAGPGNAGDAFYLSEHLNRCVCCGAERHLTKHHVVAREYRTHFPLAMKSRNSHDVVVLCVECHDRYETEAMALKKQLARRYDAPMSGRGRTLDVETKRARSLAGALLQARDRMPESRVREVETQLRRYLSMGSPHKDNSNVSNDNDREREECSIPEHTLREVLQRPLTIDVDYKTHGELLVDHIREECSRDETRIVQAMDKFCSMWRQHFVGVMKPQFLNEHWDVNRSAYRESVSR